MNNNSIWAIILVLVLVVVGVLLFKGTSVGSLNLANRTATNTTSNSSTSTNTTTSNDNTQNFASTTSVVIDNMAFTPSSVVTKAGTKVTWTNNDTVSHTVTADVPTAAFPSSGTIAPGGTYSVTFSQPGTYTYHCSIHPTMKGTVSVTQ
jgi:plastocyanin